jgi:hypothetical protein
MKPLLCGAILWAGGVAAAQDEPRISFSSPRNNSVVSGVVWISLSVNAPAGVDGVVVRSSRNSCVNMAQFQAPPYRFAWDTRTFPNGWVVLRAMVWDKRGGYSSSEIRVRVSNPRPQPAPR